MIHLSNVRLRRSVLRLCALGLLLATLAYLLTETSRQRHEILAYSAVGATDAAGASVRPAGTTRELVLPLVAMDSHWWLIHAERFAETGRPVRHTDLDNPPAGRNVHWSSAMTLPLVGFAHLLQVGGASERDMIEQAALWLSPVLLLLVLSGLFLSTRRRLGDLAAAILIASLGTAPAFFAQFAPGEVDHHGLATTASLCSLWLLALASADAGHARRAFAAAGVAGGFGLWISAATFLPVLGFTVLGALLAAWLRRRHAAPSDACFAPSLWITWGRWGAGTSLLLYAFEYLPGHASWRLEVNHPVYAVAWWGGAAWLARLIRFIGKTKHPVSFRHEAVPAAIQAIALLLPPVLILGGGRTVFCLGDPLLWALHRDYIHEFRPLHVALAETSWLVLPWLWLIVPWAAYRLRAVNRCAPGLLTAHILLLVASAGSLAMTFAQLRWQGLATAFCAGLAAACWHAESQIGRTTRSISPRFVFAALLLLTFLQFPLLHAWQRREIPAPAPDRAELASLVVRDVAWALHGATDPTQAVVLSGPTTSTQLAYFGGFRVLGTLYWENIEGLHAAAAIFGSDERTALELCLRHRVTHLVLFSWDDFGAAYDRLHHLAEKTDPGAPIAPSLARHLSEHRIPRWLRPLAYDVPPALGLADQRVQIYEIHPEQSALEACLHLARYQREIGDLEAARRTLSRAADLFAADAAIPSDQTLRVVLGEQARALGDIDLARRFAPAIGP